MHPNQIFKSFSPFKFNIRKIPTIVIVALCSSFISSCGNSDAEIIIKKFCSQVIVGESVMDVVARAGKVDFDKYWLEKFDKEPSKGENIGIIRSRDLENKTEKLIKMKNPITWDHGQFKSMIQELGYSRHVCSVDFTKGKVLKKEVLSVD